MPPRPDFAVSQSALGTPHVSEIADGHGVIGCDGKKLARHVGVVPSEGGAYGASLLKLSEIDLNSVAFKRLGVGFVQRVQVRQSLGQDPLKGRRGMSFRGRVRQDECCVSLRFCRIHGTGFHLHCRRFSRLAVRTVNRVCWPKQPFPPHVWRLDRVLLAPSGWGRKGADCERHQGRQPCSGGRIEKGHRPKVFARGFGQNAAPNKLCEFCSKTGDFGQRRFTHARGTILNARCS